MSSLPDYDPNNRDEALDKDKMNRVTVGVFEMGSTFKGFTTAMALDSGAGSDRTIPSTRPAGSRSDASRINDFHGKHRWLTVPEIFIYSSNVGSARDGAGGRHASGSTTYLRRLRPSRSAAVPNFPRPARPIVPQDALGARSPPITMSFGHGISVIADADGGRGRGARQWRLPDPPTFLPRTARGGGSRSPRRSSSPRPATFMRHLFRLNVMKGSGKQAAVPGYSVGGKTGTAEKVENGRYSTDKRRNAFLAAFPMDDPRYLVLVVLDEPKPEKPGMGATAGLNAAPDGRRRHHPAHRADAGHRAEV